MKCGRCGKKSIIELRYAGDFLCKRCFLDLFEKRVRRTIRLNRLLKHDDRIAVGLSGGKDSVVTLHILKKLSEKVPGSSLIAISVDEGIRGYSKGHIRHSKEICKKMSIEHHVFSMEKEYGFNVDHVRKKITDVPMCSYCGVLRRRLLNDKARELDATKIATGHNLDDEIQVMMMNVIRGELNRIARMGAIVGLIKDRRFVPRIKPLRECPDNEVLAYAKSGKLDFYPKKCPYARDAFRATVRNALNDIEKKHPGSKFQLLRTADDLIPMMRGCYKTKGQVGICKKCGEPASGETCKACEMIECLA